MENITITIESNKEQTIAWMKALTRQLNEMHSDLSPANLDAELLDDAHAILALMKVLTEKL